MSGYHKPLYILPFDHRSFLAKNLFKEDLEKLSEKEKSAIVRYKRVIYDGFLEAEERGLPKGEGAILVDEEYGLSLLEDAKKRGVITIATTEKSGTVDFQFLYGENFRSHLKRLKPTFAKALVHWNSKPLETELEDLLELRELSLFCKNEGILFLLEPLTPVDISKRAETLESLIADYYRHGINVDVWKVEGVENRADYERIVRAARAGGRTEVGVVVLGRGEDFSTVKSWLKAACNIPGIIGFAVGRSVFWESILSLHEGKISEAEASSAIADKFLEFYRIFLGTEI